MKNFSLFLSALLMLFISCNTDAQKSATHADIDVTEFKSQMEAENIVILDVRTPEETAQGKIEGAIELDIRASNFTEKVQELDKTKTYLVYCRSGRRSVTACNIMAKEGFKDLKNLLGGYNQWKEESK